MLQMPPVAIAAAAEAMSDGARKYGARNWRDSGYKVQANVYISAALRHLYAWAEGEDFAEDSGVHHLGHVIACAAILLDAEACGALDDNRWKGKFAEVLKEANTKLDK